MSILFAIWLTYNAVIGTGTYVVLNPYPGECDFITPIGYAYKDSVAFGLAASALIIPAYPGLKLGCELAETEGE